ncbi:putative hydroquinone glucosyltransferase [Medicago truncatula]|uniref:Glycosyltransferase n=1 Tax=Medicago truncatula TaxID=3880 RepID=A0A396GD86_MEDTR|nr:hydroquinone glucosyltransferase [Medicago truncatula]RHN38588.1 putative hydroquinone glucosyltransferase [Medicago truncatula]
MEQKTCIAMIPCPGLSHLIPFVEFAKLLVLHHNNFHVTFLIPTLGSPTPSTKSILNSLPPNIDFTFLPQINIQDLPPNIHIATQMKLTVKHSIPYLHQEVNKIVTCSKTNFVGLVFDLFSSDVIDIAKKFNLMSYIFATSSVISLQFCLNLPKLDESVSSEFMDTTKTFDIPDSNVSFKVKDFPDPVLFGRSSETYKAFLCACQRLSLVDGVIINSFTYLEHDAIKSIQDIICVYPVGPIIQRESKSKENKLECITWLNNKPSKSVLFISFGSGGALTHEQINEIAFGLESSGCNFLWVIRIPNKHSSSAYFSGSSKKGNFNYTLDDDPLNYLPLGFLERTKDQGLVVPSWAPQVEILSHSSTGGFLTHCGWSSSLEGLVYGVPMIAWPLFAEQRMNAAALTDVFKVAVRPKIDDEDGIVKGEEVARVIKIIMNQYSRDGEGLQLRKRIEDLRVEAAAAAVSEDGSSRRALSSLVLKWEERVTLRN